MDQEDRATRARTIRDTLFGEPYSQTQEQRLPVEKEIQESVGDWVFGEVWSRPGLPIRTRSLITIAMLAALYRSDQLRTHVQAALRIGVTPEEILETIMQVGAYSGLPCYGNARSIARQVFKEQGIIGA